MTQRRKDQIEKEARRRLALWLTHSTFYEMSVGYSYLRFAMSIGLHGYCFPKEDWMIGKRFNNFAKEGENADLFVGVTKKLYHEEMQKMKQLV